MTLTNDIATLMKILAVDAVDADKPVAVMFGTVASLNPLTVEVEQKFRLSGEQLCFLRTVVPVQNYLGIWNDFSSVLRIGDTAVLLREQGGQRFIILGVV
ncbi:MAG: DUF2577 domain-containing protein [Oscillospiraceae bacterium]|nr:DUF2577 domain-containing protein [Oscillospiraceae bacterium]